MDNTHNKNAYFGSREAVGKQIAEQLDYLKAENTSVLAVSPGGLIIAKEIADALGSDLNMLQTKHIGIPGGQNIGIMNSLGDMTYSQNMTKGEIEEYNIEYRNNINASKFNAMHDLHISNGDTEISPKSFSGKYVIIVSDMAKTGTSIKAAIDFLKPADTKAFHIVTAVSQTQAVDLIHQYGDKVFCLHATDKDFGSDHYFADNTIPNDEKIHQLLKSPRRTA